MRDHSLPETQQIQEWIDLLDAKTAKIQSSIDPLVQEQVTIAERRRLLVDLLASFERERSSITLPDSRPPSTPRSSAQPRALNPLVPSAPARNGGETIGQRVRRQVGDILTENGGQMQINDIHSEFLRRGYEVPGQGRPANITIHLTGSDEIISPSRGIYRLASAMPNVPNARSTFERSPSAPMATSGTSGVPAVNDEVVKLGGIDTAPPTKPTSLKSGPTKNKPHARRKGKKRTKSK